MKTYTKEFLWENRSCWILPDGSVFKVPQESHDDHLPDFCTDIKHAENTCVRVSCCWGYTAPISEIFLPKKLTTYQAQVLVGINESLKELEGNNIEKKIDIWHNPMSWNEILESV